MKKKQSGGTGSAPLYEVLIVDGFNLIHRDPESAALLTAGRLYPARRRLIEKLERVTGAIARRIHVVFDGRGEGGAEEDFDGSAVEITYSPSGTTADLVIERLVRKSQKPESLLVVTSDRMERDSVDASGARHMGCGEFMEWIQKVSEDLNRAARQAANKTPANPLGEWFPEVSIRNRKSDS